MKKANSNEFYSGHLVSATTEYKQEEKWRGEIAPAPQPWTINVKTGETAMQPQAKQ